jgi:hypothetical protein
MKNTPRQGLRDLVVSPLEGLGLLEQSLEDHMEIERRAEEEVKFNYYW